MEINAQTCMSDPLKGLPTNEVLPTLNGQLYDFNVLVNSTVSEDSKGMLEVAARAGEAAPAPAAAASFSLSNGSFTTRATPLCSTALKKMR